jgi:hypothetical protein
MMIVDPADLCSPFFIGFCEAMLPCVHGFHRSIVDLDHVEIDQCDRLVIVHWTM